MVISSKVTIHKIQNKSLYIGIETEEDDHRAVRLTLCSACVSNGADDTDLSCVFVVLDT